VRGSAARPFPVDEADADFLTGFAGLLGVAIERRQADAKLQEALKYQALLTRTLNRRSNALLLSAGHPFQGLLINEFVANAISIVSG
jgi:GAF domain-containing protein